MKRLLTILFAFSTIAALAQVPQRDGTWREFKLAIVDSLGLPKDTFTVPASQRNLPWLAAKGDALYLWSRAAQMWVPGSSTPSLSAILAGSGDANGYSITNAAMLSGTNVEGEFGLIGRSLFLKDYFTGYYVRIMPAGSVSSNITLEAPLTSGLLALTTDIPTDNSQLTNGAGYIAGIDSTTFSTRDYSKKVGDSTYARIIALGYQTAAAAASTYVPLTRTITINGTALDLSANRSFTTFNPTLTSPGSGHYIRYNGSAWVNSTIQSGDIPALSYLPIAGGTLTGPLTLPTSGSVATGTAGKVHYNSSYGIVVNSGSGSTGDFTIWSSGANNYVGYAVPGSRNWVFGGQVYLGSVAAGSSGSDFLVIDAGTTSYAKRRTLAEVRGDLGVAFAGGQIPYGTGGSTAMTSNAYFSYANPAAGYGVVTISDASSSGSTSLNLRNSARAGFSLTYNTTAGATNHDYGIYDNVASAYRMKIDANGYALFGGYTTSQGSYTIQNQGALYQAGAATFAGAVYNKTTTGTDAGYTVASTDYYVELPAITAARAVTLPTASSHTGRTLVLVNLNTTANAWTFAAAVSLADGTTTTTITNAKTTTLYSNGTVWRITSVY
jgi:hypothetical protein